jgi:hypothetical protein
MIEQHKTYTGDTRWVQSQSGLRELRCRVREYTIWSCMKCSLYFWEREKAMAHVANKHKGECK